MTGQQDLYPLIKILVKMKQQSRSQNVYNKIDHFLKSETLRKCRPILFTGISLIHLKEFWNYAEVGQLENHDCKSTMVHDFNKYISTFMSIYLVFLIPSITMILDPSSIIIYIDRISLSIMEKRKLILNTFHPKPL